MTIGERRRLHVRSVYDIGWEEDFVTGCSPMREHDFGGLLLRGDELGPRVFATGPVLHVRDHRLDEVVPDVVHVDVEPASACAHVGWSDRP